MWREAKFATDLVFGGLGGVFASVALAAAGAGAGAGRAVRVWRCGLCVGGCACGLAGLACWLSIYSSTDMCTRSIHPPHTTRTTTGRRRLGPDTGSGSVGGAGAEPPAAGQGGGQLLPGMYV